MSHQIPILIALWETFYILSSLSNHPRLIIHDNDPTIIYPCVSTFFLPKLTDDELLLLENKDENYLKMYSDFHMGHDPDVKEADMLKSKSKSKFAYCLCERSSGYFSSNK